MKLGSLRRKRVSLGIDFGTDWVRACVWSVSKRRPDLLELGTSETRTAIPGPGHEYLEVCQNGISETVETVRNEFVSKTASIFGSIVLAVGKHYGKEPESLDFTWVVVAASSDETFYRLAIEDSCAKIGLDVTQFISPPLAASLGEWAYQMVRVQQGKQDDKKGAVCNTLVVDVGSGATKIGIVSKSGDMFALKACNVSKVITNRAFELMLQKDLKVNSQNESDEELWEKCQRICHDLLEQLSESGPNKSPGLVKQLEWFKRVNAPLLRSLRDLITEVVSEVEGFDETERKLIILGGGVQLPGVYKAVINAAKCEVKDIFYPRWTPDLYIVAMGASVQAGIVRMDKSCPVTSKDANMVEVQLGILREIENTKMSIVTGQTQLVKEQHRRLVLARNVQMPVIAKTKTTNKKGRVLAAILHENLVTPNGEIVPNEIVRIDIDRIEEDPEEFEFSIGKFVDNKPRISLTIRSNQRPGVLSCTDREFHDHKVREAFQRKHRSTPRAPPRNAGYWPLSTDSEEVVHTIAMVQVHIVRAHGLARADTWGKSDPYCVVLLNGEKVGQTLMEKKTLDPVWDQKVFLSSPGHVFSASDEVCVDVYDHDTFSSDDFLGRAAVKGDQIHEEETWYELGFRDDLPKKKQRFVKGSIALKFVTHQFALTESMLNFNQQKEEFDLQQLLRARRIKEKDKNTPATTSASPKNQSPLMLMEESDDSTDSEDEGDTWSGEDLKLRWRILSGNVPIHGFNVSPNFNSSAEAPPLPPKPVM